MIMVIKKVPLLYCRCGFRLRCTGREVGMIGNVSQKHDTMSLEMESDLCPSTVARLVVSSSLRSHREVAFEPVPCGCCYCYYCGCAHRATPQLLSNKSQFHPSRRGAPFLPQANIFAIIFVDKKQQQCGSTWNGEDEQRTTTMGGNLLLCDDRGDPRTLSILVVDSSTTIAQVSKDRPRGSTLFRKSIQRRWLLIILRRRP